jgi:nucleoside-diphosphate-sugar epimerase
VGELRGTRVAVTGAGGFLGSNLVVGLAARGAGVGALVRPGRDVRLDTDGVTVVQADVTDRASLDAAFAGLRPTHVVHAAFTRGHPESPEAQARQLEVSVTGTANVLEAAVTHGVERIVHVGSSLEYGHRPEPLHEELALEPVTFRGAAKAAATSIVLKAARTGAPAVVVRPFSVYGPREPQGRLVPTAIRAALGGEALPLTEAGLRHDFVYVDDVVRAIVAALTTEPAAHGRVYNVGTGVQTTNEGLAALVGEVVGRPLTVAVGAYARRDVDSASWVADVTRARDELGFEAAISLREGLELTVEWWRGQTRAAA